MKIIFNRKPSIIEKILLVLLAGVFITALIFFTYVIIQASINLVLLLIAVAVLIKKITLEVTIHKEYE